MHICDNGRPDAGRAAVGTAASCAARGAARGGILLAAGVGWMLALLAGCASPGPPRPPSLKLPEIVSGSELTATRVGDEVRLHWTTPSRTTDKLLITDLIVAEICRDTVGATAAALVDAAAILRKNGGAECSAVKRVQVTPGASEAVDALPAALTAEPPRLLAYRVQLLNAAGRTAGPSPAVYAAAGPSVRPVEGLIGRGTKNGVVLEWTLATDKTEAIELDRTVLESPAIESPAATAAATPSAAAADPARIRGLPGAQKELAQLRLRAGDADSGGTIAGGTIDRSAQFGRTYRYSALRVRSVVVGGQTLEMLSVPSAEVTVALRDEFPPDVPQGLVAVPSFAGETDQAAAQSRKPAIDLSWEPNAEPRIAGYRVYRQNRDADADAWRLLDAELVAVAAYRDATVAAGQKYAYRVTAVNEKGGESQRSDEVVETAPTQ
jgi:hypothetical protein